MIEMKHINLSFRDKDLFTDQEIKIDSGKITLITGESGSGKSTLLFELARLTDYANKEYIYEKYPNIWELQCCIKEFRNIFKNHNVSMLYLFVEKYSKSLLKPLRGFAEGLKRDIDAVENAVAYVYSNGFVEGTNSRLKMIKRTMYGRCGRQLLEAKLRYMGYNNNNG